ncbi:MAG: hypothetical protein HQL74_05655 [Magnetococcales bacterium]|nr:hypothetical protein [Magnetococcales bacterium]
MSTIFDSLAYVKRLKAAGMPESQAEVQAETIMEWMEDRLATKVEMETVRADLKRDIKELDAKIESVRADLKRDIESVRADLKRDIKDLDTKTETRFKETDSKLKEMELRMVIKMGAMILGGIGLLFGLMRAWPLPVQYIPPPAVQEMRLPAPSAPTLAPSAPPVQK